jgi:hypothetical protein
MGLASSVTIGSALAMLALSTRLTAICLPRQKTHVKIPSQFPAELSEDRTDGLSYGRQDISDTFITRSD